MVTWRIVDDDVKCLHVERNPTIACSGSHLYKFYRWQSNKSPIWRTVDGNGTIRILVVQFEATRIILYLVW
jgi:hypothetical protein